MGSFKSQLQGRTWNRDGYLISTDPALIPIPRLISIFASDEVYWAKPLPEPDMQEMLDNSLCFGLYQLQPSRDSNGVNPTPSRNQLVGFARCITDFTTFLYLTDVWVDPSLQGQGLGGWLVKCTLEVIESMPHLRRSMLFTADWNRSVPFYEKLMDMKLIETQRGEGLAVMERKGRGHPNYGSGSSGYN